MEPNKISVEEIIKLTRKIRENTERFINCLRQSLLIEKDGEIVNPKSVLIKYFDGFYIIDIDDYSYKLNESGEIVFSSLIQNEEAEMKGKLILENNKKKIKNFLLHLQINKPQYYVSYTDDKGYMRFEDMVDGICVKGNCNKISIEADFNEKMIINYKVNTEEITIENRGEEISLNMLLKISRDVEGMRKLCDSINALLKEFKINNDKLPLIIRSQLENKKKGKKL